MKYADYQKQMDADRQASVSNVAQSMCALFNEKQEKADCICPGQ